MNDRSKSSQAEIHWEGDSKEVVSDFPLDVKSSLGFSLRRIQNGKMPRCESRPMPSIGPGVIELKESDERTWYRVMYLTKVDSVIHVLHCFEKDSRKTDKRDLDITLARLKVVQARIREKKRDEKHKQ